MNQQVTDHLKQIAHLFLKKKDQWRSKAFSRVAGELEIRHRPLEFNNGKLVTKIAGAGASVTGVIEQFVATGTSNKLQELRAALPNEIFERFDAKTCKRKVNELLKPLTDAGIDWGFAGSMRRGSSTVKDVDVIITLKDEEKERALVSEVIANAGLTADIRNGQEKVGVSIPIKSQGRSFTLDLNFTYPESRGAMYLYFTGPKAFNIGQRGLAKRKGLRLNQRGLFREDGTCIASKTEEDMFQALGLEYIDPSKRA